MIPQMPDPPKPIEVWWVMPEGAVDRIECRTGKEATCVFGVLYGMRADKLAKRTQTDAEGIELVSLSLPQECFVVQRPSMRTFISVLQANHVHGTCRKAGDDETHVF